MVGNIPVPMYKSAGTRCHTTDEFSNLSGNVDIESGICQDKIFH